MGTASRLDHCRSFKLIVSLSLLGFCLASLVAIVEIVFSYSGRNENRDKTKLDLRTQQKAIAAYVERYPTFVPPATHKELIELLGKADYFDNAKEFYNDQWHTPFNMYYQTFGNTTIMVIWTSGPNRKNEFLEGDDFGVVVQFKK